MRTESRRQAEAFDIYYMMGDHRSYDIVAEAMGVSKNTIANWSKMHNWGDRIRERNRENSKKIFEETDVMLIDANVKYRKIIAASIDKYISSVKDGAIKITCVNDFIKLVELDLRLAGMTKEDFERAAEVKFIIK